MDAIIEKWKSGKLDTREAYLSVYKKLIAHDKHIGRRYNNMSGSNYLMIISGQVADGVVSLDELSEWTTRPGRLFKNGWMCRNHIRLLLNK